MSIEKCVECGDKNTYFNGVMNACPMCGHEWLPSSASEEDDEPKESEQKEPEVVDCNGNELLDGDSVTVIQDLRVRGSSMVVKRGTRVRSIRLTNNPEEVDCRVDGTTIVLKTSFLRK